MGKKALFFTYALGGLGLTAVVASIAIAAAPGFREGFPGGGRHGHGHGYGHGDGRPMLGFLKEMDVDGDGSVTRIEIETFHAARATAIDSNGDGEVTVGELEAHREAQRQQRMAAHLASMDSDGDGKVSVAELQSAASWKVARLDRDGDGIIELRDLGQRHGHGRGPGMENAPGQGPVEGPDGSEN